MRSQLTKVDGVEDVMIDYNAKKAYVKVKPGTDPNTVAEGLTGRYSGTIVH